MKRALVKIAAIACALAPLFANAETPEAPLSSLALLNRCYAHLTQRRLPQNHPLRAATLQGTPAIEACLSLLDSASLNATGAQEGRLKTDTTDGRLVLRNFNDFHRTWFPRDDFDGLLPNGELAPRTDELHDSGEPALHYTRALFTDGVRIEEVVTGSTGMEALRTGGAVRNTSRAGVAPIQQFSTAVATASSNGLYDNWAPIATELVQKGELIGVRRLSLNPMKRDIAVRSALVSLPAVIPLHRSSGGGILGTRSFLASTLNLEPNTMSDGGVRVPREFPKTVLSSFLCREIPVIRTADALPYVQTTGITAATPPFRTGASCMGCHATIDPIAGVARNFMPTQVPWLRAPLDQESTFGLSSVQLYEVSITSPKETVLTDSDANYSRRPPTGRFYFRNYKGALMNEPMTGIEELGRIIASTEDFYVCTASRYLQLFTGVKVALNDPGDANTVRPTAAEKEYRELVVRLGLDLKQHQSLRRLVRQILESPLYQSTAMRLYGEIKEDE